MIFNTKENVLEQIKAIEFWKRIFRRGFLGFCRVLSFATKRLRVEEIPISLEVREIPKNIWPPEWSEFQGGELKTIPKGLKERDIVYGRPILSVKANNRFAVDRAFAKNLGTVSSDHFPNYSRRLYMHKKVAPYFVEAMRRAYEVCPDWKPKRIGCFNPRRMRHSKNPRVPFSDHAYAIAFDIDPSENRAWSRKKYKNRPRPFEKGWEKYSNIPEGVVLAFESVGFDAGMRWKTFCDPMHFSLRKLGK